MRVGREHADRRADALTCPSTFFSPSVTAISPSSRSPARVREVSPPGDALRGYFLFGGSHLETRELGIEEEMAAGRESFPPAAAATHGTGSHEKGLPLRVHTRGAPGAVVGNLTTLLFWLSMRLPTKKNLSLFCRFSHSYSGLCPNFDLTAR